LAGDDGHGAVEQVCAGASHGPLGYARMRRSLPLSRMVAVFFGMTLGSAAAKSPREPVVDVVTVDGVIDHAMAGYLEGTIADAERAGSTVVLQLDTPGSMNVDAISIARTIFESRVPVVVWVGPSGADRKSVV